MKNLKEMFEKAYDEEMDKRRGTSPIRVMLTIEGKEKVYEKDGNFFLCGFSGISFIARGSDKGKELKRKLEEQGIEIRKDYPKGKRFSFRYGNQGNGDHQIQVVAYRVVANYLQELGYEVGVYDMLD